jgi:hypothetical protein
MNTPEQLAILTERLSNHMDATEAYIAEDRGEKKIAAAERHEMLEGLKELRSIVSYMKPVTDMVQSARAKLAGAVIILGFLGTIIMGGIAFWKEQIINFFWGT